MSQLNHIPKSALKFAVCLLLLAWIFHAIFLNEAKAAHDAQGQNWETLGKAARWKLAWTAGPAELWSTIRGANPLWLGVSLGCVGVVLGLGIARWRLALRVQKLDLPWQRIVEISLVAHFFNSFLLGSTGGDLSKAYFVARESRHLKTEAVVTVVVDRLLGLFAMLAFAVSMMPFNSRLILQHKALEAISLFILAMFGGLGTLSCLAIWGGFSRAFPNGRAWLRKLPKGALLETSIDACRPFGRDRLFLTRAFLLSALLNTTCVLQVIAVAQALHCSIPLQAAFLLVPSIICISALPVTPSGLGVRENLFVLLLTMPGIGLPPTTSLSISILAFAGSLAWSLVGGALYFFYRDQHHLAELSRSSSA